jgi:hypothetical protein
MPGVLFAWADPRGLKPALYNCLPTTAYCLLPTAYYRLLKTPELSPSDSCFTPTLSSIVTSRFVIGV